MSMRIRWIVSALGLATLAAAPAAGQCQVQVLPNPGMPNLGKGMARAGDILVFGTPDYIFENKGLAFVYRLGPDGWTLQTTLTSDFENTYGGNEFGAIAAADGDVLVVGDDEGGAEFVRVYRIVDGMPTFEQDVFHSAAFSINGSVDVDGDMLVVGEPGENSPTCANSGAAYLYRHDGKSWNEEAVLYGDDTCGGESFGWAVAAANEVVLVGDHTHDGPLGGTGAVYAFRKLEGEWLHEQTLKPSDVVSGPGGSGGHRFGMDLALDKAGDTTVIGAHRNRIDGLQVAGSAYIFEYDGVEWVESAKLTANPPNAFAEFGKHVDISDDGETVIIAETFFGSWAVAHFFRLIDGEWVEVLTIPGAGWINIGIHGDIATIHRTGLADR